MTERVLVDAWQWVVLVLVVLLPMALMLDFWGDQRLSSRGRPGARSWRPAPRPAPGDDDHH